MILSMVAILSCIIIWFLSGRLYWHVMRTHGIQATYSICAYLIPIDLIVACGFVVSLYKFFTFL